MDASVAKLIGAGIAMIGVVGAGVGIGILFGNYVAAGIRNPAAAPKMFPTVMIGMALSEATAIFSLVIALMLLFVF